MQSNNSQTRPTRGLAAGRHTKRSFTVAAAAVLSLSLIALSGCSESDSSSSDTTTTVAITTTVKVGALLDLTGDGKTLGLASQSVLEAGVESAAAEGVKIELDVRDTGGDPETALKELTSLNEAGVTSVIGPQTSSEAKNILPYADANGMILISQGSTASTLAVPTDSLFRMVPTDKVEGIASGDLITYFGPVTLITANRDDAGNNGLVSTVSADVAASGNTVIAGPTYAPEDTDFAGVAQKIADAVASADSSVQKAVYLAGYGEVAQILAEASGIAGLQGIPFFGGDGSAQSTDLTDNATGAAFAAGSADGFASPLPVIGDDAATPPEALLKADPEPDPLAYGAYDALMILTAVFAKDGADLKGADLRTAFMTAAEGFKGVTGVVTLDASGDRATMPYAYWGICEVDKAFEWKVLGGWVPPAPTEPATTTKPGTITLDDEVSRCMKSADSEAATP
jgi:branched-chain amino acid transport system substrate-binding protein